MALTAQQTQILTDSYALIRREPVNYSNLFYDRLLREQPFTRVLFPDDLSRQIRIFMESVDVLVAQLDDFPTLQPTLADLAKRHVGYGVKAQHYAFIGQALIDTFEEILADRFTKAMREAWEALYGLTADVMIRAAYPEETARL